ncbi:hypothetical protein HOO31_04770 [Aliarcobacter cryaerophilus]|uniref:hypothetical protein n=1 Tax=Aliarcobacter cryaerophilus TaxID=28198 RepID=UPI00164C6D85|nr:hypothetical protein [Aliarcobacter cryaerophilus]QNK85923.1 hypothetical protein HOO31_04770 [Aliarcobacter cryaerophilus]
MKKTLIVLGFTIFAFADGQTIQVAQLPAGCAETKLTEVTSILSCPSGEYKATFYTYSNNGSRNLTYEAKLDKIGEVKPIIIQQNSK